MKIPPIPKDVRQTVTDRDMYVCGHRHCFERTTEIAHRIAQTKANVLQVQRIIREVYGLDVNRSWVIYNVIHHPKNLILSCQKHNSGFNIGNRPEDVKALVGNIVSNYRASGPVRI